MWGQDDNEGKTVGLTRIIPTRVGTSKHQNNIDELSQDHPHACGDKQSKIILRIETLGSSPRVWGQDKKQIRIGFFARIIPTRVGTSWEAPTRRIRKEDHPHACGDKLTLILSAVLYPGSSPRVWGQVVCPCCGLIVRGIIPTRVGTSRHQAFTDHRDGDHPHACGDK